MAQRETLGENIEPGIIQRVVQGVRYAITGVGPTNFFGPMQPLQPAAQTEVEGRAFDYPVGYNLRIQPRSGEQIGFADLRALADGYDLMRLVIETRKDQIKSYEWDVVPKDLKADPTQFVEQIAKVKDFLLSPDKEHTWDDWMSMMVEDLLVIDAVCVYPRMNRGGKLYGFELVDGATIKRVIDDTGRTPMPPSPAYQQIIKGIPAADYSRDTLLYWMRNPRTSRIYGYSPVEQVLMTVNIALRRQLTQIEFYTVGNVPEAIAQVPETWTPKQIEEFQLWWDSVNDGSAAQQKRRMRFIPSLKDIQFPRQAVLKDEFDEWIARIICFAFSIPPTAFIKQLNRATAEQAADSAAEEGLRPLLRWLETKITTLINRYLDAPDLAFAWKLENEVDPKTQADIDSIYIAAKVKTPDEVREGLGLEAMTPEERDAAFPEPTALGPDGKPMVDEQGKPMPAGQAGLPIQSKEDKEKAAEAEKEKATEKVLADAVRLIKAQPPTVVEVRPEVNVDVGDTNVHSFPQAQARQRQGNSRLGKMLVGERLADGRMAARWVDDPNANPLDTGDTADKVLIAEKTADGKMVAKFEDVAVLPPMEKKA